MWHCPVHCSGRTLFTYDATNLVQSSQKQISCSHFWLTGTPKQILVLNKNKHHIILAKIPLNTSHFHLLNLPVKILLSHMCRRMFICISQQQWRALLQKLFSENNWGWGNTHGNSWWAFYSEVCIKIFVALLHIVSFKI